MINKKLIERKINRLDGYVSEIEPVLKFDTQEIPKDVLKLRMLERNFQLIVDTVLDINTHIISAEKLKAPEDMTETFIILGNADILPGDFVKKISPVAGLRNMVVHDYEKIDIEKLINDIKKDIHQFREYAVHIDNFMKLKQAEGHLNKK